MLKVICGRLLAPGESPGDRTANTKLHLSQYTSFPIILVHTSGGGFVHVILDVYFMCRLLSKPDHALGTRSFYLLFKSNCIS